MPRTILTFNDRGQDREIDSLWDNITTLQNGLNALTAPPAVLTPTITPTPTVNNNAQSAGITVQLSDSSLIIAPALGLSLDVTAFGLSQVNGYAQMTLLTPFSLASTAPLDIASADAVGTSTSAARADHVHKGLHSLAYSSQLFGDVLLAAGSNVSLAQSGQTITIASTASGISGVGVDNNGTLVGTRPTINLIPGTNITLSAVDNSGSNRVDVTLNAAVTSTQNWTTTTVLSNYTALSTDQVILAYANSAAITVTLPTAVGNTGKVYIVKNTAPAAYTVTVQVAAAVTVISLSYAFAITVVSDGIVWQVVAEENNGHTNNYIS